MPSLIHPTAVIESGANLGRDISVGPFAVIEKGGVPARRTSTTQYPPLCYVHVLLLLPLLMALRDMPKHPHCGAVVMV